MSMCITNQVLCMAGDTLKGTLLAAPIQGGVGIIPLVNYIVNYIYICIFLTW
jgi:hypothetical protein